MRIGINGRFLVAKQTGVQRAAYNLITALVKIDRTNEYIIFTSENEKKNKAWNYSNVQIVGSPLESGSVFKNLIWEQYTLPKLAKHYAIDILHSPANMAPLFYKGRSIIHIHDLCFIVNPQWYSFSFRTWYNFLIPKLAHTASKVVTNSNNSRNDLLQFLQIPPDKIGLVYWAVDQSFIQKEKKDNWAIREEKNYILYVGSLEPRKNIRILLSAYNLFRKKNPHLSTKLVLIGGASSLFAQMNLDIQDLTKDIEIKGFVNEQELKKYYQEAMLVAYPSLYEGFGLPPLEAMASGTPVVTSLSSSIPEVVGDAAITVDPYDENILADTFSMLLTDKNLRMKLVEKGYEQVAQFDWDRVAKKVLCIYKEVFTAKDLSFEDWQTIQEL